VFAGISGPLYKTLDRFNQIDYVFQLGRLRTLWEKWAPRCIVVERNSIGEVLFEELIRAGLPVIGFLTSNATKAQVVESLSLALERGQVRILPHPVLLAELQSFQAERLPSGLVRYSAAGNGHDDTVMSMRLAGVAVGEVVRARVASEVRFLPLPDFEGCISIV
jgi:hypothetical protein